MELTIVKPSENHTSEIATICTNGWKQTVENKLSDKHQVKTVAFWYQKERVKQDIEKGIYTYVALIDDKVVGVIGGGLKEPNIGEIFVFYVDEEYRYKGVGKQLLERFTEYQLKINVKEQWVSVQDGNQRGIPFYEARGFTFQKKKKK
ncbi:GNAT family N-acetyltransferase [Paraliobacillus sp. X-1268]|nr:GNAT family N-acetyltransferase [Paraliobacillus sp. X-1268]